jgi:hypothetical protein
VSAVAKGVWMSIERIYYCDWRECNGHVQTASGQPPGFLSVAEGADHDLHFCDWDCLLKYAGEKPPVEVIPLASAD